MDSFLSKHERILLRAIQKWPDRVYFGEGDKGGISKYGCGLIKRWIESLPFPPKDDISTAQSNRFSFSYGGWTIELRKGRRDSFYETLISWTDSDRKDEVSQCFIPGRFAHRSSFMREHLELLVPAVREAIRAARSDWQDRVDHSLARLMHKWAPLMVLDTMIHGSVVSGSDAETGDKVKALMVQVYRIVRDWTRRLAVQYPAAFRADLQLFGGLFEFNKSDMKFRIPNKGTVCFPLPSHYSQEVLTTFLRCFPALMKPLEDRVAQAHVDRLAKSLANSIESCETPAHFMADPDIRALATWIHYNLCEKGEDVKHDNLS